MTEIYTIVSQHHTDERVPTTCHNTKSFMVALRVYSREARRPDRDVTLTINNAPYISYEVTA